MVIPKTQRHVPANRSEILKEAGLRVRVLVGDEDSSTIAAVHTGSEAHIYKFADTNHLYKHFNESLIKTKPQFKETRAVPTIPHIERCFGYAVKTCNGDATALANTLRNLPDHFFNHHENYNGLHMELKELFGKFAKNATEFSVAASSQENESFNNLVAHKAPKNHLSPGKHTASFMAKKDEIRKRRAEKARLPAAKKRRNFLAKNKEVTRQNKERQKAVQYQSNCGLLMNVNLSDAIINPKTLCSKLRDILISSGNFSFVYFHIETSGFSNSADILQIAAKFNTKQPLKSVISDRITERIASEGITFDNLQNTHEKFGTEGIKQLLPTRNDNGKPRINKDSRILKKISDYFNKNKNLI
ncbi:hypothetical protein PV328_011820 [Microctonus aethiopoides]|uniref:Uncharacterized protein n=1 Tax=Microctonus aethiopoides TaxID=144406 RepID=A0AA39KQ40_9HYME|nr:hypothetical protein PV328_011820 [Microctonus aethiopoides]